jgi:hypothetical protein
MITAHPTRRKLLGLTVWWPWVAGCTSIAGLPDSARADPQRRFKGIGLVLVLDAIPGAEMNGVVIKDDRGFELMADAVVNRRNRDRSAVGRVRVPPIVRVTWTKDAGWDNANKVWNKGVVVGDYTIPVAERIPDEALADIRAHGGSLRLKFRLKPDGVLFGWDIERDGAGTGYTLRYDMPGGDFLETRY